MEHIWCDCGAADGEGTLWIPSYTYNGLYRCRFDLNTAELACSFEHEDILEAALYGGIICAENQVIMAPRSAHNIAVYESDTQEIRYYDIPTDTNQTEAIFLYCSIYEDFVYLIPFYSNTKIIKYDMKQKKICRTNISLNRIMGWEFVYSIHDSIMVHHHIYMFIKDAEQLVDLDVKDNTCRSFDIDILGSNTSGGLIKAGERILFYADNCVYTWNIDEKKLELFYQFSGCEIRKICYLNQKLYGFDLDKPVIYVYDMQTKEVKTVSDTGKEAVCPFGWSHIWPLDTTEDTLICFSYYSGELFRIKDDAIIERMVLKGEQPDAENVEPYESGVIRTEGYHNILGLAGFIDHVKGMERKKGAAKAEDTGKKVLETIISESRGVCK